MTGAAEPNSSITTTEALDLAKLLRVPTVTERAARAQELVLRAEADYTAGKVEIAYRSLRSALSAQDSNQRARDDLVLIALKSGRLGVALQAASQLIASDAAKELKARAWFNMGLACQRAKLPFAYDGTYYCQQSVLEPMLQAWLLQPSTARKKAIRQLFDTDAIGSCAVSSGGTPVKYHLSVYERPDAKFGRLQASRIYVYHDRKQSIDPAAVAWRSNEPDPKNGGRYKQVSINPALARRHDFGDFVITVLESPLLAQSPVTIGTSKCQDTDMRDSPVDPAQG